MNIITKLNELITKNFSIFLTNDGSYFFKLEFTFAIEQFYDTAEKVVKIKTDI